MGPEDADLRAELEARLRFETLLANISARFLNLPPELVEREIETAQQQVCECLGFDRSVVWQIAGPDRGKLILTHAVQPVDKPPTPPQMDARVYFPWLMQRVLRGETTAIAKLNDLPAEATPDKESLCHYGTKSTLLIPLQAGGEVFAGLTFVFTREERDWPEPLVKRLQLVAQVFSNAIARARGEVALRESEARFRIVADSAPVLIWMSGVDKLCTFFNKPWLDFTGRTAEQEMGNGWAEGVHPEDLPGCLKTYEDAFDGRKPFIMQYRLRRRDGEYRWISDNGTPRYDAEGNFTGYIGSCADVTEQKLAEDSLKQALHEVKQLQKQILEENVYLRQEVKTLHGHDAIIGQSPAIRRVLSDAAQVAPTGAAVLLMGETGTGKELIASAIHDLSPRRSRTMVRVNCAAIPSALLESELFGREKGAYTGAYARQIGSFELANHSTIFLDEISELPLDMQVKLLRVLQEMKVQRLGNPRPIDIDVRVITATNQDLKRLVDDGKFRLDLYYRIGVFPITVPPLRERREDIPILASAFVSEFSKAMGKQVRSVSRSDLEALQRYSWPGNIRELRNVIERAVILTDGSKLRVNLPDATAPAASNALAMDDAQREHICKVLALTGWQVRGKNGAAEILQMKPSTLRSRMAKLGLRKPRS